MFEDSEREILVGEFVELTLEFLTDGGIRDEVADSIVDLCGVRKADVLSSHRLFFDVASAKFAIECFPLLTTDPAYRLSEYDPFEREYLVRESCDQFLRGAAEYFDATRPAGSEHFPSRDQERLRSFAQQVEAFLSALENKGVQELGRLMIGRIGRCLNTTLHEGVDQSLMLATMLVGTHFVRFWKSAATLKTLEGAVGVGSGSSDGGDVELSLAVLMDQIKG